MRGLIIEDNLKRAGYLSKGLQEHGFVVDVASDGREGRHLAMTGNYAFAILDVMLPGIDGWTVLSDYAHRNMRPNLLRLLRHST